VRFALLQHLDRWERPAEEFPPKLALQSASGAGDGAQFCREFTRGACGGRIVLDYLRAQLVKGTNGCAYVVSPDGTTIIFSDQSAKQLCEQYSEQAKNGAQEWNFCIQLTFKIAPPVEGNNRHNCQELLQMLAPKRRQDTARTA
jgi:hypothetical protein